MGIYTAYNFPWVDEAIEAHMQVLKDICLSTLGPNIRSLVLNGSFGRGEGSVLIHPDNSVEPLRDYDIRLMLSRSVPTEVIERIRSRFMQTTGLGQISEHFSGEHGFSLTVESMTVDQFASVFVRDCDLRAYDHLHASRVIYGEDLSPPLRFPASKIPKVNGLRLLYQKMIGLVGHFLGPQISGDFRRTLIYECDKSFVEICTALVLLADAYVPSYRARAELFIRHWRTWFPSLVRELPQLAEEINRATEEKLYPKPITQTTPLEAFTHSREALLIVHQFYLNQLYNLSGETGAPTCQQVRQALQRDYFRVSVANWLSAKRLNYEPASWGLNIIYHRLLKYRFARGIGQSVLRALWLSLKTREAPLIDIFLGAWCTLAAAGRIPNESLLRCAERILDNNLGGTHENGGQPRIGWERYLAVRSHVLHAYTIIQHTG